MKLWKLAAIVSLFPAGAALAVGNLEVPAPASVQSGITAISGWHCTGSRIEVSIDNGPRMLTGSRTERLDTQGVCGRSDTGFSLLYNFNLLPVTCFGCRFHTIAAYADGVQFATAQYEVEHYRTEFLTGKTGQYDLLNFPEVGRISTLRWDESKQGFSLWFAAPVTEVEIGGSYFGALRTGAQNPACGPFPPNRVIGTKHGTFSVQYANGTMTLGIDYADGTTCRLPAVAVASTTPGNDGYITVNYIASAAASCPEFPNGLNVRVNGQRLVGDSADMCRSAHLIGTR
jgi:hypothetical protein